MKGDKKWERLPIDDELSCATFRLRVPGGWLVRTVECDCQATGLVFFSGSSHIVDSVDKISSSFSSIP